MSFAIGNQCCSSQLVVCGDVQKNDGDSKSTPPCPCKTGTSPLKDSALGDVHSVKQAENGAAIGDRSPVKSSATKHIGDYCAAICADPEEKSKESPKTSSAGRCDKSSPGKAPTPVDGGSKAVENLPYVTEEPAKGSERENRQEAQEAVDEALDFVAICRRNVGVQLASLVEIEREEAKLEALRAECLKADPEPEKVPSSKKSDVGSAESPSQSREPQSSKSSKSSKKCSEADPEPEKVPSSKKSDVGSAESPSQSGKPQSSKQSSKSSKMVNGMSLADIDRRLEDLKKKCEEEEAVLTDFENLLEKGKAELARKEEILKKIYKQENDAYWHEDCQDDFSDLLSETEELEKTEELSEVDESDNPPDGAGSPEKDFD